MGSQRRKGLVVRVFSNQFVRGWGSLWARLVLRICRPLIIGITGSAGKTTTRATIAMMLSHPRAVAVVGKTAWTEGNMNNTRGLPLAILGFNSVPATDAERVCFLWQAPLKAARAFTGTYAKVLVLEYGTDSPGYLQSLVDIAKPHIAIVTTVGPAHLERLGSVQGVLQEKSTLVRAVDPDGLSILGDNHPYVDELAALSAAPVVRLPGRGFELARETARVIATRLGIPDDVVDDALASPPKLKGRMLPISANGLTICDDSYNANPLSMRYGLETLAASPAPGRRVAILGTMAELGASSADFHRELAEVAHASADLVVCVGPHTDQMNPTHWFPDSAACAAAVRDFVREGDQVLVKGSASMKMHTIVDALTTPIHTEGSPPSRTDSIVPVIGPVA